MNIRPTVDARATIKGMESIAKNLKFAASQALNDAAFFARDGQRQQYRRRFTERRSWVTEGIQVARPFARKDNLQVTVEVEEKRDFLFRHEEGVDKTPRGKHIAVPDDDGFNPSKVIPRSKRPKAFGFQLRTTKGGKRQLQGSQRTFVPDIDADSPIVLQRKGKGKNSRTVLLYQFVAKAAIDPTLRFTETVTRVFAENFPRAFAARFLSAMRSAR